MASQQHEKKVGKTSSQIQCVSSYLSLQSTQTSHNGLQRNLDLLGVHVTLDGLFGYLRDSAGQRRNFLFDMLLRDSERRPELLYRNLYCCMPAIEGKKRSLV